ncbi:ROK family protein [Streptomyces scabiei]|uniref:ROK family protein n=1 Tax=Streptomyces scabiei TaxID=1930 RepID=UPI000A3696BA|nr:ROK family protein [Streptomyces scabiei]
MQTDLVAALDIGGTKIAGALVDDHGRILVRAQRPTPAQEDGDTVMRAVEGVLGELTADPLWGRATAVGIGSAGPVDASAGTVSPVNVPGWRGFPLVERVRAATGGLPVELIGDGVAITAADAGRDDHAQRVVVAARGARGCVERIASGPNIARRALESGWRPGPDGDTSAAAVAAAAKAGDPIAVAAFERAAQALAAGIAATATLVEIDIAVIGGGVANAGDVLFAPLRTALKDYATLSFVQHLTIAPAVMGTDAGLVGAAAAALAGRPSTRAA